MSKADYYKLLLRREERIYNWLEDDTKCRSPRRPVSAPSTLYEGRSGDSLRAEDGASLRYGGNQQDRPFGAVSHPRLDHRPARPSSSIYSQDSPIAAGDKRRQSMFLTDSDEFLDAMPRSDHDDDSVYGANDGAIDADLQSQAALAFTSMAVVHASAPAKNHDSTQEANPSNPEDSKDNPSQNMKNVKTTTTYSTIGRDDIALNGPEYSHTIPIPEDSQATRSKLRSKLSRLLTWSSLEASMPSEQQSTHFIPSEANRRPLLSRVLSSRLKRKARPTSLPLKMTQLPEIITEREFNTAPIQATITGRTLEQSSPSRFDSQEHSLEAEYAEMERQLESQLRDVRERQRALQREKLQRS
ncbi:MAG: hypothetical protein MMC23_000550 [Stictis urceolatum]|nr:hypothetical protein [Stictis urceolata]